VQRLAPRLLLQPTLIRWLHEVERSARHRMILMQVSSLPLSTLSALGAGLQDARLLCSQIARRTTA